MYTSIDLERVIYPVPKLLGRIQPDPNWGIKSHCHHMFEAHFVVSGSGTNHTDDRLIELSPGLIYIAPPEESHAQNSHQKDPLDLIYCSFYLRGDPLLQVQRIVSYRPDLVRESYQLWLYLNYANVSQKISAYGELGNIIASCIGHSLHEDNQPFLSTEVQVALDYIKMRFAVNPTLAEVATVVNLSPRHLSRIFLQQVGMSVRDFTEQQRYSWARQQLENKYLTIAEITHNLSFSSVSYFSSWFKKLTGLSPSAYRNQNHANNS